MYFERAHLRASERALKSAERPLMFLAGLL